MSRSSAAGALLQFSLERVGVEADGERTIVHQGHGHVCAKHASARLWHVEAGAVHEQLVEVLRLVRCAGFRERGAVSSVTVGEQGKLGNYQHFAIDIGERQVGFAVFVVEDAQAENLAPKPLDLGFGVVLSYAEQDEEALPDAADGFAICVDARIRHALDHCPHFSLPPVVLRWLSALESTPFSLTGLLFLACCLPFLVSRFSSCGISARMPV